MKFLRPDFGAISRRRKWVIPMLVGALTTLFFAVAYLVKPPVIERMSNLVFDVFQQQHPRDYDPDVPVRIIDIDDESIRQIGQWPWPRTVLAKLNIRLAEAGAAVIAYDIIFSEADRTSPENILSVLQSNPNANSEFLDISDLKSHDEIFAESFAHTSIINGLFLINTPTPTFPKIKQGFVTIGDSPIKSLEQYFGTLHAIPTLEDAASGTGHVSFRPDESDGVVRTAPLLGRIGDQIFPALSVEALRAAQGANTYLIRSSNASNEAGSVKNKNPKVAALRVGDFEIPTTPDGKINIYYTKPPHAERYIPAWKILSDNPFDLDWANRVDGQIVFIGTGSEGLKDIVQTSFRGGEPGVLVHAQVTEQILTGDYLLRPYSATMIEFNLIIILGVILTLILPRLTAIRGVVLILIFGNTIYWGSYYAFVEYRYLIDPIYPILSVISSYILVTLTSFYMTESERSRIRGAFSLYLSPEMVKQVSENPALLALGGEEKEITILFLDIRSFSRISETMRPQDITTFLNKFLTPMTDILQDHNATIDKYIGDAIVAFWNAPIDDPVHEVNAALAVLEMQKALADLNAKYRNQDEFNWPDNVNVGIGINTGICCVGNLGSEQRFSYSMIGDPANLASRIEGLTKQYRLSSLVGSKTAKALPNFAVIEADKVSVVGRDAPETIYMLAGDETVSGTPEFLKYREMHNQFLHYYQGQQWDVAEALCKELAEMAAPYNLHNYYSVMKQRIEGYLLNPLAENWDGVYHADEK